MASASCGDPPLTTIGRSNRTLTCISSPSVNVWLLRGRKITLTESTRGFRAAPVTLCAAWGAQRVAAQGEVHRVAFPPLQGGAGQRALRDGDAVRVPVRALDRIFVIEAAGVLGPRSGC